MYKREGKWEGNNTVSVSPHTSSCLLSFSHLENINIVLYLNNEQHRHHHISCHFKKTNFKDCLNWATDLQEAIYLQDFWVRVLGSQDISDSHSTGGQNEVVYVLLSSDDSGYARFCARNGTQKPSRQKAW